MNIHFDKVLPLPLSEMQHIDQSIWNNSFELKQGEKVLLNAASGKGKTTFTEIIAGIRKDFSGTILLDDDKEIKSFSPEEWAELRSKKLSFIFQDLQLLPDLTVQENLQLKNILTNTFTDDEIKQILNELEIEDKWETPCKILSMGQQQRVAIIRALCQPFEWLIMDEPFSHLDDEIGQKAFDLIQRRTDKLNAGFILTSLGRNHNFKYDRELKL